MPDDDVEVAWQVADDERMSSVVAKGSTVAVGDWAHSVHVEVEGLKPDHWYFYQFKAGGEVSPIGRARTMPSADSMPESLRFGVASCAHYEQGLFTAYQHMAKEDLDLVAHLGDYLYEYAAKEKQTRQHIGNEINSLADYRNRHAQYKTDADLQAAHLACPWIVAWDDHEFDNNCANDVSEEKGVSTEKFLARRANAYRAYYEHMPLRRSALPNGPDMKIYRRLAFGRLAEFSVLDTRQYRSDQPCGDGNKPQCDEALGEKGTLLGDEQETWLMEGLSKSSAAWNVLAQQVMMARVDRIPGETVAFSMDQWPGYEANRRRLLKHFVDGRISNPVMLGGDIHSNWANNLIADFDDYDSAVVGSEFVTTSISSGGDGKAILPTTEGVLRENPFVKLYNSQRGYLRCEVTPKLWRTDYRVVEKVTKPGAPRVDLASFVVEAGQPGVKPA
jgi:alkaline phosphatase D